MIDNTTTSKSPFCLKCACQLPFHYAECPELEQKYIASLECKLRAAYEERDRYKADSEALDWLINKMHEDNKKYNIEPDIAEDVPEHLRKRLEAK